MKLLLHDFHPVFYIINFTDGGGILQTPNMSNVYEFSSVSIFKYNITVVISCQYTNLFVHKTVFLIKRIYHGNRSNFVVSSEQIS